MWSRGGHITFRHGLKNRMKSITYSSSELNINPISRVNTDIDNEPLSGGKKKKWQHTNVLEMLSKWTKWVGLKTVTVLYAGKRVVMRPN
jgi:hypothetical protein